MFYCLAASAYKQWPRLSLKLTLAQYHWFFWTKDIDLLCIFDYYISYGKHLIPFAHPSWMMCCFLIPPTMIPSNLSFMNLVGRFGLLMGFYWRLPNEGVLEIYVGFLTVHFMNYRTWRSCFWLSRSSSYGLIIYWA